MPIQSVSLTRRQFMLSGAAASALCYSADSGSAAQQSSHNHHLAGPSSDGFPFQHGVASGDPLHDRVILWTRITPPAGIQQLQYRWRVASDVNFTELVAQGQGFTDITRDFTVKVDADGLSPGHSYYYLFEALGQMSDIGRTRTLPQHHTEHLRIAFTSCSNYARGYFNVYKDIARRPDLDVVLHLGDYIYEYDNLEQSLSSGRLHQPAHEILTLADYRQRHACYKRDNDLQQLHRQHPVIVIWDDHEVADNAWGGFDRAAGRSGGAGNHQAADGDWQGRLAAAVQAYMEWMPIREQHNDYGQRQIYRSFRFGDLLQLNMLDTRLAGRDGPSDDPAIRDAQQRTLLGYPQERWLEQQLSDAQRDGVCWKLLGQQVMMAQFQLNHSPLNHDQWDGYPAARQRLFDHIRQANIDNFVVLTGDIHSSWALALNDDPFADQPGDNLGVELVTPAVTSPGIDNQTQAALAAASLESLLPHLNFVDFYYRGYVLLDITRERIQAEWWAVDNVQRPRYASHCLRALVIPRGQAQLQPAPALTQAKPAAALAPDFSPSFSYLRRWRGHADNSLRSGLLAQQSTSL